MVGRGVKARDALQRTADVGLTRTREEWRDDIEHLRQTADATRVDGPGSMPSVFNSVNAISPVARVGYVPPTMIGFAILLAFNLLGLLLQHAGVPLPASVIGLILFVASLFAGAVKLSWVEPAADVLLRNMLLFFAPVIVGALAFLPQFRAEWPAVTLGIVVSTIASMLAAGWAARAVAGMEGGR